jgi:Domain of Unknown Function (DUF1080)
MTSRTLWSNLAAASLSIAMAGCASTSPGSGWTTLVDGVNGMDNFVRVGEANWTASGGAIHASKGGNVAAFLVSKAQYKDFQIRAEFWSSDDANSGIFIRCQDPNKITDENCYEANIFDQRPDPSYGTGAIVKVAKLTGPMLKAGGKWNTFDITAKGSRLVVVLNGTTTVDIEDAKFSSGPIALQWGRGEIKFRKVEVRPL